MASKGQSKDKAIAVGECRYEMTIAQVVSRRDLIAQVNIILGGCDSEDRAIAEFLNFTVRAQDLLDVSADIANTASFGEINGMDTAREQLDDASSDEDRQFEEMEDAISEPDDRNGNLQRDNLENRILEHNGIIQQSKDDLNLLHNQHDTELQAAKKDRTNANSRLKRRRQKNIAIGENNADIQIMC